MLARRTNQRGDTLIEVLFAITVLSLAIVMSLSIMNQGTAASVRSLQITLVRQEIDSQAEALRFLNSAFVSAYSSSYAPNTTDAVTSPSEEYFKIIRDIKERGAASVSQFGETNAQECREAPNTSFILNPRTSRYYPYSASIMRQANEYAYLTYTGSSDTLSQSQGLWVEAIRSSSGSGSSYIDFHIRACWGAPGLDVPMNLGTIVRLYDPAN